MEFLVRFWLHRGFLMTAQKASFLYPSGFARRLACIASFPVSVPMENHHRSPPPACLGVPPPSRLLSPRVPAAPPSAPLWEEEDDVAPPTFAPRVSDGSVAGGVVSSSPSALPPSSANKIPIVAIGLFSSDLGRSGRFVLFRISESVL